jgi:sugar phosphate isomerase/epimerase
MIFGAITNSWRQQLESQDLIDLAGQAERAGARHIELRQTCLGQCEQGSGEDWRPNLDRLASLLNAHPSLTFNLALALPCLTQIIDPQGEYFQAALAGARLVGKAQPHLRLVDPSPFDAPWESPEDIPAEALNIADLATAAARQGVVMSLENSGQPIRSLAMLVGVARARMSPAHAPYLGLCPDPTNQLRRFPGSDPLEELDALPLDAIKMVHFKQLRNGEAHGSVDDRDLNCLRMRDILNAKGYAGPAIMEIPPDPDVFYNLAASFRYLGS